MATTLADQLRRLAVPQTSVLAQTKSRASLLFEPKEAANFNRETFYEIGVEGLKELIKLNPDFEDFKLTLFSPSTKLLERSVQSSEANTALDGNIKKFFVLLSPYFLMKPAHQALEWLINRFHIQDFNVDEIMMLIMPYHDTRMFVRMLQLLNLSNPTDKWHWLQCLQKPGVPLSKTALLNHCATDIGFMKFICESTLYAVRVARKKASSLQTLLAFSCTTIMGALEHSDSVTEAQVTQLLPMLSKGCKSSIQDLTAGTYFIIAQLSRKSKLSERLLNKILERLVKEEPQLRTDLVLVLLVLYNSQDLHSVPPKALIKLTSYVWLPQILATLSKELNVMPFIRAILKSCSKYVQEDSENLLQLYSEFVNAILEDVEFDASAASEIIRITIEMFKSSGSSDDVKIRNFTPAQKWYANIFRQIERRYPATFRKVTQEMVKSLDDKKVSETTILNFLSVAVTERCGIDEKLCHAEENVRAEAIPGAVRVYSDLKDQEKLLMKDSLQQRLSDDSPYVVATLLDQKDKLLQIIPVDLLMDGIFHILKRKEGSKRVKSWNKVKIKALELLCSEHLAGPGNEMNNRIFLLVLPFLFPTNLDHVVYLKTIVDSHFGRHNELTKILLNVLPSGEHDLQSYCQVAFEKITVYTLPSDYETVFTEISKLIPSADVLHRFFFSIIIGIYLSSHFSSSTLELGRIGLHLATLCHENCEMSMAGCLKPQAVNLKNIDFSACVNEATEGKYPLQAFLMCIDSLSRKPYFPDDLKNMTWWDLSGESGESLTLWFSMKIFGILASGILTSVTNTMAKEWYIICLKNFLKVHFSELEEQLKFFSLFWFGQDVSSSKFAITITPELQLFSLQCAMLLLKKSEKSISWTLNLQNTTIPSLLIAMTSPLQPVRQAALSCLEATLSSIGARFNTGENYFHLAEELFRRSEEIKLDPEQPSFALYLLLSPDSIIQEQPKRKHLQEILNVLLNHVTSPNTPIYVVNSLLSILKNVNSEEVVIKLSVLGNRLLPTRKTVQHLDEYRSAVIKNILTRFDNGTIHCIQNNHCCNFFIAALMDTKTCLTIDGETLHPSAILIEQISRDTFDKIPSEKVQLEFLKILVNIARSAVSGNEVSIIHKVFKKIVLDAKFVLRLLERMRDEPSIGPVASTTRRRRLTQPIIPPNAGLLETDSWKEGIIILEIIQNKKKLKNKETLLPILFDVLKRCLLFEEQTVVEYIKQLILSCILHCCNKMSKSADSLDESKFNVELVVQCIRITQNPQTHHHALLLLSKAAELFPEQVLHNIMAIFTFMGSSIMRQDDMYSFHVITKIIETIVPTLVKASHSGLLSAKMHQDIEDVVTMVLRVFVDVLVHVPEHRRFLLFYKLLQTLDADMFLWLFLCLVCESHVVKGAEEATNLYEKGQMPKKLDFTLQLSNQFAPKTVLRNVLKVLEYIKGLPTEKDENVNQQLFKQMRDNEGPEVVACLFNVQRHTAKQLRHFVYTVISFVSSLLSSTVFMKQIASMDEDKSKELEPLYKEVIVISLSYISKISRKAEEDAEKPTAKYWKTILNLSYDILEKVNNLLPSGMFVNVVHGLLGNKSPVIRRKAMEILNSKLHYSAFFSETDKPGLYKILALLVPLIQTVQEGAVSEELELNQQTALFSIKLLARLLASENQEYFKEVLHIVTDLLALKLPPSNVLASLVLCLGELCNTLKAHSIHYLSQFIPSLLKLMKKKGVLKHELLLLSVVTAVQKVVENLHHFLSPYLQKLLREVCNLSAKYPESDNQKTATVQQKLKAIRLQIAQNVPPRVLVPASSWSFDKLVEERKYSAVGPLFGILTESFCTLNTSMSSVEFNRQHPEILKFFSAALEFRATHPDVDEADVSSTEGYIVDSLSTLVLKLSESTFRPLYYKLFSWAANAEAEKERAITFYRLSSSIAEKLKGLFVLFASHFLQNASELLDSNNLAKTKELSFGQGKKAEAKTFLLLEYILRTLHSVFLYDNQKFVNEERFETLMQPLVDQLENVLGGDEVYQERMEKLVVPCVAQFAVAVSNDVHWKQLNYQILLKTRNNSPKVRLYALKTLCEVTRKIGDEFLPFLPETVPFLAELLEDEEEEVEAECQKTVQEMEKILGEPIQKYF